MHVNFPNEFIFNVNHILKVICMQNREITVIDCGFSFMVNYFIVLREYFTRYCGSGNNCWKISENVTRFTFHVLYTGFNSIRTL